MTYLTHSLDSHTLPLSVYNELVVQPRMLMHPESVRLRWDVCCISGAQFVSIHCCLFCEPLRLLS